MSQVVVLSMLVGIIASGIRLATSYLYASIGETICQLSGVLNLGCEGMMLMGAYVGYYSVFRTGNCGLGVAMALVVGGLMGLMLAFISVTLGAEQGISGIGLYLFGLGLSDLLFKTQFATIQTIPGMPDVTIPVLSSIPILGPILFRQNLLVYGAFAMVPISWFILNRTTVGLVVRSVGQNPEAADGLGINVAAVRYAAVVVGGALAGLAGASLSIALLNVFQPNLTSGQGFIAVALVYFGGWKPARVMLGSLLFSTVNALQLWIQARGIPVPSDIAVMMPYVITILALVLASRQAVAKPAALTKPFDRSQ